MNLPKFIFGTSCLGNLYIETPKEVKRALIREYLNVDKEQGISFFDCAGKYGAGLALESLGECLKELEVAPEDIIISNKLGWSRIPLSGSEPTFEPGVWKGLKYDAVQKISYHGMLECYEQGNQLLNGYPANYVSVHDPDEYMALATDASDSEQRYGDILEAYRALRDLKRNGMAKAIGVGAKDWRIIQKIDADITLDWVMIANSMTVHDHPSELLDFMKKLERQGTVIINSAVFNAGFLTGGQHYNYQFIDPRSERGKKLYNWREQFVATCEEFNITPAAVCINFGISAPGVQSLALSTTNPNRIGFNADLLNVEIPAFFWKRLFNQNLISKDGLDMMLGNLV